MNTTANDASDLTRRLNRWRQPFECGEFELKIGNIGSPPFELKPTPNRTKDLSIGLEKGDRESTIRKLEAYYMAISYNNTIFARQKAQEVEDELYSASLNKSYYQENRANCIQKLKMQLELLAADDLNISKNREKLLNRTSKTTKMYKSKRPAPTKQ